MNAITREQECNDRRLARILAAVAAFDACEAVHPGVASMVPCWYPVNHETPHSWETLRPGETWRKRDRRHVSASGYRVVIEEEHNG